MVAFGARMLVPLPVYGCVAAIGSIAACEILKQLTKPVWLGGIPLPYLSDAAAEGAGYFVFAIGQSLAAAFLISQHAILSPQWSAIVGGVLAWHRWWLRACALACAASCALILFACFSAYRYPEVHEYSGYVFFCLYAISITIFTVISGCVYRALPDGSSRAAAPAFPAKLALCVLFWIALVVYLPVGAALAAATCSEERLRLDSSFCTEHSGWCDDRERNDGETFLWDYSGCAPTHTMRAVAELVCAVALFLYQATFVMENAYVRIDHARRLTISAYHKDGASFWNLQPNRPGPQAV